MHGALWVVERNLGWVRWPREGDTFVYCALRRRVSFLTGEMGISLSPVRLDELPLIDSPSRATREGCRIQLGPLMQGHDQWWASGGTEALLLQRLDWLALQIQLRLMAFVSAASAPR